MSLAPSNAFNVSLANARSAFDATRTLSAYVSQFRAARATDSRS
eukprot:CAMPEP_0179614954 /NCGR_PEP_ID=MMETSP0930-20121108/5821_1 /TAXON_ID=548131 ORGANISM="Ostreococcus mediterraneus, Strain clade-D-RCC1621" /NCGR_SAMPLE_ID=MMETSP0930 /ASSEMBLY_ACC=CAM_ASM_000580 /LENGTH=43 /DNA_ID= /DNA_START= /DNA_END= /DNA_ORIENTATION=